MTSSSPSSVSFPGRALILLGALAGLGHFNRVAISVVGNVCEYPIPEAGVGVRVQMGWIYSAFYLSYTICMLCGHWIDRVGPKRSTPLFCALFRMERDLDGNRWNGHGGLRPPEHADRLTRSG